jgi:hypothetical protein
LEQRAPGKSKYLKQRDHSEESEKDAGVYRRDAE